MKFIEVLHRGAGEIKKHIMTDVPEMEAEILLEHLLAMDREKLYVNLYNEFPGEYIETYNNLICERIKGKPIAYITGKKEFMSLEFLVNSSVLIPRPDTEILVEEVISLLKDKNIANPIICDIGTGSGNIAVSLAKYIPGGTIYAVDISKEAIIVAEENCFRLVPEHNVTLLEGNLFTPFQEKNIILM